jgi:hypothetical protein
MDFLTFFLILLILVIIFIFILLISNKPTNNTPNTYRYNVNEIKKIDNSYKLIGNEEKFKDSITGYENELIYQNNLKEGDYVKQFTEIDFSKIPKTNNQIGFNPQPRETSETKLPFADINVNCL